MDNWTLMHRYRRLTQLGKANELRCPDCNSLVVTAINPIDDEPMLWCPQDNVNWQPGLQFYADMKAVVTEHYLE